jgi:YtfJ family uncharacterized protein
MSFRLAARIYKAPWSFLHVFVMNLAVCIPAQAANVVLGGQLPQLLVQDKGELVRQNDQFMYRPWNTNLLLGKVQVVHYLAARLAASKLHEPFTDALRIAALPVEKYESTTLINVSDVLWGTAGLVEGELKSNKKKYPHERLISDAEGIGLKVWGFKTKSSAIMILDKSGKIIFFTESALDQYQIAEALDLIRANL